MGQSTEGVRAVPRVSVVIPTYNRAHFLRECIGSVLVQSFRDFEVIVVDDGSTDDTRRIVSGFPVRYIYQENGGAPAARNKGLRLARGEYIIFLDSDDVMIQGAVGKGVAVLEKHPEVGFSYGQAYSMDERGRIIGLRKQRLRVSCIRQGREELGDLIFGNHILSPTVMIRRKCLEEMGGFDPTFRFGSQDFELWVRLAQRHAVAYIAKPLAKSRVHAQSITSSRTPEEMEQTQSLILESIFNDQELGRFLSAHRPIAYSHLYLRLAEHAYSLGQMRTARKYLFKAMKSSPVRLLRGLGLPHVFLLAKTWIPSPVLASVRTCWHYIRAGYYLLVGRREKLRLEAIHFDSMPGWRESQGEE